MPSEIEIEPHMSVEELNIHICKFESDCKTANRLHLIKQVMKTKNVGEACEIMDIPTRTAYEWIDKWNKKGIGD